MLSAIDTSVAPTRRTLMEKSCMIVLVGGNGELAKERAALTED